MFLPTWNIPDHCVHTHSCTFKVLTATCHRKIPVVNLYAIRFVIFVIILSISQTGARHAVDPLRSLYFKLLTRST